MKNLLSGAIFAVAVLLTGFSLCAQDSVNDTSGDKLMGTYSLDFKGETSKVKISKSADGTFSARTVWVKNRTDKNGNVRKDTKNPDKSLRNVDCDKIVLFEGLSYNSAEKVWDGAKIYDPTRGMRANVTVWFKDSRTLALKGSIMGLSETVYWTKL